MKFIERLITGVVLVGFLTWLLLFMPPLYFNLLVIALIGVASYEFFTLLRQKGTPSYRFFGVSIAMIIPVVVWMEQGVTRSGEVLFIILACLFLFLLQFSRKNNEEALIGIAVTLFGILYVSWFSSFVLKILFLSGGPIWVAYLIAVTKSGDIGAYLCGSLMGHHALMPHVSPKKSVEGMFGGLALSVLVSALLGPYLPIHFHLPHLLILGVILGVVGQIGDLSESLMKRSCHVKDSGTLFPGMGGVLDIVDSILFTAPIFYFHLRIFIR